MESLGIKNMLFRATRWLIKTLKDGLLVNDEFDCIFNDLFNGSGAIYKEILESLKMGIKTLAEIREAIAYSHIAEH